jgi:myosin-9
MIQEHLDELREEKAALAATLPSLARAASDDDLLSTDGDLDDQDSPIGGSVDDLPASSQSRSDSRPRGRWNPFSNLIVVVVVVQLYKSKNKSGGW